MFKRVNFKKNHWKKDWFSDKKKNGRNKITRDNRFSEERDVELNHKMDNEMNGAEYLQCIFLDHVLPSDRTLTF